MYVGGRFDGLSRLKVVQRLSLLRGVWLNHSYCFSPKSHFHGRTCTTTDTTDDGSIFLDNKLFPKGILSCNAPYIKIPGSSDGQRICSFNLPDDITEAANKDQDGDEDGDEDRDEEKAGVEKASRVLKRRSRRKCLLYVTVSFCTAIVAKRFWNCAKEIVEHDSSLYTWTRAAEPFLSYKYQHHWIALPGRGAVLLGGQDGTAVELYDPQKDMWHIMSDWTLPLAATNAFVKSLPDSLLYIVPGTPPKKSMSSPWAVPEPGTAPSLYFLSTSTSISATPTDFTASSSSSSSCWQKLSNLSKALAEIGELSECVVTIPSALARQNRPKR